MKDALEREKYRIEDNIRKRTNSTSALAGAIKRLYEIKGVTGTGPKQDGATVALIAKETGKSERTVATLRTIAELIPELSKMLDAKAITQKVAYQLAQMTGLKAGPTTGNSATVAEIAKETGKKIKYYLG